MLPSYFMFAGSSIIPIGFSLAAVFCWGTSDFVGGYAGRRTNAFLLASIAHGSGIVLMTALALANGAAFPSRPSAHWALAAGACGGVALAILYRTLAAGKMGLTTSLAAVVAAGVSTAFSAVTEGLPGKPQAAGFLLAGVGIWLISRSDQEGRPQGLVWAIVAGLGFGGFFVCIKQAGEGSALWVADLSRVASFVLTATIVVVGHKFRPRSRPGAAFGVLAGCLDVMGSLTFVQATQRGRLDAAVVISSLYSVVTVLLARLILKEQFTRWRQVGIFAALAAVPLIALP